MSLSKRLTQASFLLSALLLFLFVADLSHLQDLLGFGYAPLSADTELRPQERGFDYPATLLAGCPGLGLSNVQLHQIKEFLRDVQQAREAVVPRAGVLDIELMLIVGSKKTASSSMSGWGANLQGDEGVILQLEGVLRRLLSPLLRADIFSSLTVRPRVLRSIDLEQYFETDAKAVVLKESSLGKVSAAIKAASGKNIASCVNCTYLTLAAYKTEPGRRFVIGNESQGFTTKNDLVGFLGVGESINNEIIVRDLLRDLLSLDKIANAPHIALINGLDLAKEGRDISSIKGKATLICSQEELLVAVLAWTEDISVLVLRKLAGLRRSLFDRRHPSVMHNKILQLTKAAVLAMREAQLIASVPSPIVTTNTSQRPLSICERKSADAFSSLRKALSFIEEAETDPTVGYRRHVSYEQLAVTYAPYWIPVLIPLIRWNA